jgi:hypothetical protein
MQSADPRFVKVAVRGPGGASATAGGPTVTGTVVHQPLGPLTSRKYTVEYRVVSQDGHPVSGALSFTLVLPEPGRARRTDERKGTGRQAARSSIAR